MNVEIIDAAGRLAAAKIRRLNLDIDLRVGIGGHFGHFRQRQRSTRNGMKITSHTDQ